MFSLQSPRGREPSFGALLWISVDMSRSHLRTRDSTRGLVATDMFRYVDSHLVHFYGVKQVFSCAVFVVSLRGGGSPPAPLPRPKSATSSISIR